jgi:hypothetical protein
MLGGGQFCRVFAARLKRLREIWNLIALNAAETFQKLAGRRKPRPFKTGGSVEAEAFKLPSSICEVLLGEPQP